MFHVYVRTDEKQISLFQGTGVNKNTYLCMISNVEFIMKDEGMKI